MIKVFTESTFFNGLFQIFVGGRHQTNIYRNFLSMNLQDVFYVPVRHEAVESVLHNSKVSDFIQKDSTTVGCYKSTRFISQSTGKRTFHVTEELRSSQFFGDRTTIYGNKRFIVSFA